MDSGDDKARCDAVDRDPIRSERGGEILGQPGDSRLIQGGFARVVAPTEDIAVVHRPVLGIDRDASFLALFRRCGLVVAETGASRA